MPKAKKRCDKNFLPRALADLYAERERGRRKESKEENGVERDQGNISTGVMHEHNFIP